MRSSLKQLYQPLGPYHIKLFLALPVFTCMNFRWPSRQNIIRELYIEDRQIMKGGPTMSESH